MNCNHKAPIERLDAPYQNSSHICDGEGEVHRDEAIDPELLPPVSEEVIISTGEVAWFAAIKQLDQDSDTLIIIHTPACYSRVNFN